MLKALDQIRILRANEYARIARWVRDSEHGWLFYDHRGRAHSINADEAVELEATAQRQVERHISRLERLPMRIIAAAIATFCYHLVARAWLPAGFDWLVAITIAPFIFYFLFEASSGLRFRIAQQAWRKAQARRFQYRPAVPTEIETHHRRHNLFRLASYAFAFAALGHAGWLAATAGAEQGLSRTTLILAALGWLFFLPANRVDATHRRRKWLG